MKRLLYISLLVLVDFYYSQTNIKDFVNHSETTFVDVRIKEEHQKENLKNTVNIPLEAIEKNLDFFKKQKQVVLFCNSGRQARQALEILQKNGINAKNGINWENIQDIKQGKINLLKNISFSTEKPDVLPIIHTENMKQVAIGLGKGAVLKKHKTKAGTLATLFVLKGEVQFVLEEKNIIIKESEVFEIPADTMHEVIGLKEENLFIVTQKRG